MATVKQLSFGIKTAPQHTTYADMRRIWLEADAEPLIDHAWLFDHFMPIIGDYTGPCLEGWSVLSAFAEMTKRLRLGLLVTGNTYRCPAVLAKIAATVDVISEGRLDFGIGAGWNEREHAAYGIPLYKPGERIRRLGEACEVIRLMWTEKAPDFNGRYYQIKEAYCEPKPVQKPHPPFVIGGSGEQLTLRVVAEYADIWNFTGDPSGEAFQHKSTVLDDHCAAIGRDPATIVRSVQLALSPNDDLGAIRETMQRFISAGAAHFVLTMRTPYPENVVRRVAKEIVEPLKSANPS